MIIKVLKNYQSLRQDILTVGVREDVEILAQKINQFAPEHFPADGFITYQIALEQVGKGKRFVPYIKLFFIICEEYLLKIFISREK